MRIAFVGTGVMGASMAGHLLRAGHEVVVHTRTRAKAEPLLAAGARWADSPAAAVAGADAALSMVGYPADVEQVWRGFLSTAPRGCLLIDLTTSSPALARRLAADAAARGLRPLDAPVSGGDRGAREATLTVMTGGSEEDHAAALPVLSLMGRTVERLGGPGAGQLCKLANQIAVASGMVAMTETLAFARAVGLDLAVVHRAVSGGAAGSWPMTNLAPRVLRGDFAPGFYAKHLVKDLGLALETARECGVELPGLELAARLYDRVLAAGDGDLGTQALARRYFGAA
ncbi:MAG: 2-hydroxy-3-oxopropionate reductase [Verrucomicrobiota bacterium]|jgi:3-hydroxyisobutyrate dehydrogenase